MRNEGYVYLKNMFALVTSPVTKDFFKLKSHCIYKPQATLEAPPLGEKN